MDSVFCILYGHTELSLLYSHKHSLAHEHTHTTPCIHAHVHTLHTHFVHCVANKARVDTLVLLDMSVC